MPRASVVWASVGRTGANLGQLVAYSGSGGVRAGEMGKASVLGWAEDTAAWPPMLGNLYREPRYSVRVSSGSSPPPEPRVAWWTSPLHDSAEDRTRVHKNAQECSCPLIGDMVGERYAYHARA